MRYCDVTVLQDIRYVESRSSVGIAIRDHILGWLILIITQQHPLQEGTTVIIGYTATNTQNLVLECYCSVRFRCDATANLSVHWGIPRTLILVGGYTFGSRH